MKENFVAMKASLLVVASFGLVAYGAVKWKHSKQLPKTTHQMPPLESTELVDSLAPESVMVSQPKPLPEVDQSLRLEKIIQANLGHVTRNRSIVIFENGTSVIVEEPSLDLVNAAKVVLAQSYSKQIKFKTYQVENGRTIVAFEKGSIFHWLFPDDVAAVGQQGLNEIKELLSADELETIQKSWNPPLHARLGLTARKWLVEDVVNLRVVKILKGDTTVQRDIGVGQVLGSN